MGCVKVVRQGGVLSPILFTLYSLLESLCDCGLGCYWEDHFSGALCYADDLTILAPCPDALRKMLAFCEEYAESHGIRFNASKTQLICFRRTSHPDSSRFWFCGQLLPLVDSVLHLGNTLQHDLSDKLDIQRKTMAFIRQANSVLCRFKATDPFTKMRLFHAYCLSLYGCALWRLDYSALHSLSFICHVPLFSSCPFGFLLLALVPTIQTLLVTIFVWESSMQVVLI